MRVQEGKKGEGIKMQERYIPHEERCPVCGTVVGCEDKYCRKPSQSLCGKPECEELWANGIVHRATSNTSGILPCCGLHLSQTKPGDRATIDPTKVTCKGKESAAPSSVA
jgi:hypothetical protein